MAIAILLIPIPALRGPGKQNIAIVPAVVKPSISHEDKAGSRLAIQAMITAYCLNSKTTSGPTPRKIQERHGKQCIALSRKLAKDLGLKCGPGQYDYRFGAVIEVTGIGRAVFADLMPTKWRGYRVDLWLPTAKACRVFGVQRKQVRVVKQVEAQEK